MLTLKEIAEAKMALAEGVLLPSVWTARAFDAAEAWAKLATFVPEGVFIGPKAGGFVVRLPYHDDFEATGETLEAAVAALFDKIGATDEQS